MRPTFGDVSRLRVSRGARPRFGDIVVFASSGLLVAHRIVGGTAGGGYRTKGDGLAYLDRGRVPAGEVLGVVAAFERKGRAYGAAGGGARAYSLLAGSLSSLEGFLYRFAWRSDAVLTCLVNILTRRRPGDDGARTGERESRRPSPPETGPGTVLPGGPDAPAGPVPAAEEQGGLLGVSVLRRSLRAGGRAAFAACDACLFELLHDPPAGPSDFRESP